MVTPVYRTLLRLRGVSLALGVSALLTALPAQAEPAKPIRIGALSASAFPESSQAARAYFDAINSAGGIKGRLIEYRSLQEGNTPRSAAQAAQDLINDPDVVALAGSSGLMDCPVNAASYASADLFSLQGASVAAECFTSSHTVPLNNGPYLGLANAVAFARDQLKSRKLCIALLDLPGMVPGYKKTLQALEASGQPPVDVVAVLGPEADPGPMVKGFYDQHCDAIVFTGHEPAVARWLQSAAQFDMNAVNWLFLTPAYTDGIARLLKTSTARAYVMAEFEPWQSASLPMLDWKRLMRKAGLPLTSLSQGGYVAAQLLVKVLRRIDGPITRASVSQALREMPPTKHSFLGMPFHVGKGVAHAPNRTSLPMTLSEGYWHIASPVWLQAADLMQP